MSEEHGNVADDTAGGLSKTAGNYAGKYAGNKAKQMARKTAQKAMKFLMKKGVILLKKLLIALSPLLLKGAVVLVVVLMVFASFKVIFERGEDRRLLNDPRYENIMTEDGELEMSEENETTMMFYKYFASKAMFRVHEDRPDKFDDTLEDFYERESMFMVNHNLLLALDEFVHRNEFRYPEQFTKHIPFCEEELTIKDFFKNREILLESVNPTNNRKEIGLWDFGLAPVLIYSDDELNRKIEGTYVLEDYWCDVTNSVQQRNINIEFSEQVPAFPRPIHLISKALTMVGEFEFEYVTDKVIVGRLQEGTGSANEPVTRVLFGEHREYEQIPIYGRATSPVYGWMPIYDEVCTFGIVNGFFSPICEMRVVGQRWGLLGEQDVEIIIGYEKRLVAVHNLYRYREGHVFEYRPIVDDISMSHTEPNFLLTFLSNYETYVPKGVMSDVDFSRRIRQGGLRQTLDTFREQERVNYSDLISVGGGNNLTLTQALQYFEIVEELSKIYGITDPHIIIAIIAQESGGNPNVNQDGLMQITHSPGTRICAKNFDTGQNECITVTEAGKLDIRTNIQMGIMHFQSVLFNELVDGDFMKALFAYNLGIGGLRYIRDNHPESLQTGEWLNFREDARAYWGRRHFGQESCSISNRTNCVGPIFGDHLYIENVMRFYMGSGNFLEGINTGQINNNPNRLQRTLNFFRGLGNDFLNLFREDVYDYSNAQKFYNFLSEEEIADILTFAKAMEEEVSFLEVSTDFYLEAFNENFDFIFATNRNITTNSSFYNNAYILGQIANLEGYIAPIDKATARWAITSPFGYRIHPFTGRRQFHFGIDIGAPTGTPLFAVNDGIVIQVSHRDNDSRGKFVNIRHEDGNISRYYHMDRVDVQQGQIVQRGQLIGTIGSTGMSTAAHLHFEFLIGSTHVDPGPIFFPRTN